MADKAKKKRESQGLPEGVEELKAQKVAPMRRIVIETDGNSVNIAEADVSGIIELKAILLTVVQAIDAQTMRPR